MKVHEQGNALIDALAEQYGAEDLPGALGDVLYPMLTRAIEKGARPFHLAVMLLNMCDKLPEEPDEEDVPSEDEFEVEAEIAFDRGFFGDAPFGPFSVNGGPSSSEDS